MGGSKSGDAKRQVVDYYISALYGFSEPVDEVLEIHYGEKPLWDGSITGNATLSIDRPDLLGGNKVEGGFRGRIHVLMGGPSQLMPQALADALVRNGASATADPQKLPGLRRKFCLFVTGGGPSERNGANIGSNAGVVRSWWTKVRAMAQGDPPFDPVIWVDGMKLANPAAMIWDCLVTEMHAPASLLDADSFTSAATTLLNEGFGLAMRWHQPQPIEEFVGTILDHIDGTLAQDPFTGKVRLKLARADYDIEALPVFGPHNAELTRFQRRGWGEVINRLDVVWTNPANEQTESVTVHNTAAINLVGGEEIAETREYIGVRTADLALRLAQRDMLAGSSALAAGELVVNRQAWATLPGDVIALQWPRHDIDKMAMRVTNADYGKPGDSHVTLTLIEDVFSLPEQSFVSSDGSAWVNPAIAPVPLAHEHVTSSPYYLLAQAVGDAAAEALDDTSDVEMVFGTHPATGIHNYEMVEQASDSLGNLSWQDQGTVQLAGRAVLADELVREVSSTVPEFDEMIRGYHAQVGTLMWIGPVDQTGELAVITAVDGNGYTLRRGILDTVPQAWPATTPVWFLPAEAIGNTQEERAISETVTLRYLTRTALGRLAVGDASDVTATMSGRLHLPYRPANVTLDGQLWPDPEYSPSFPATLAWAGRNRLDETALINAWDDGAVTPEAGATFEVRLYGEDSQGALTLYHTEDVGTATTYAVDPGTDAPSAGAVYIWAEVWALRDGLYSWQAMGHRMRLVVPPADLTGEYVPVFAPTNFQAQIL